MNQVLVQERVCEKCGADVRPESLFCYSCGERVTADGPTIDPDDEGVSPDAVEDEKANFRRPGERSGEELRSAALLRKRLRTFERKPVEVIWETPAASSDARFIAVTILLLFFAAVVVGLALYMR